VAASLRSSSSGRKASLAAEQRKTALRRLGNILITPRVRLGLAGKRTHIPTKPGRKSGRSHSTPVQLVIDHERWLASPYGDSSFANGVLARQRSRRACARR
jgi:hypothetical protein